MLTELLNNTWIAGIGTGVLSGALVTWVTNRLISKRDEKELARSIEIANREILYALRTEVSEEQVPALEVVEALINATARRHKLEARHLLRPKQIAEELIKEIMDSSFISSLTKKSFCASLKSLMPMQETELDRRVQKENEMFVGRVEYRERLIMLFSITLGLISAFATLFLTLRPSATDSIVGRVFDSLFPMALILGAVVLIMNVMLAAMKMRHRRLRQELGVAAADQKHDL